MFGKTDELTIKIECQGHTEVSLEELLNLQGSLKNLTEENYVKLRNSMTEFGFSFPIFYWQDEKNQKWIIDAHQRVATLHKMRDEGWTIPKLPADRIFAKDKKQAKKKLLVLNSRYGEITDDGLTEFLNEEGFEIPFEDMSDYLEFPEMGIREENERKGAHAGEQPHIITCPSCGNKFEE